MKPINKSRKKVIEVDHAPMSKCTLKLSLQTPAFKVDCSSHFRARSHWVVLLQNPLKDTGEALQVDIRILLVNGFDIFTLYFSILKTAKQFKLSTDIPIKVNEKYLLNI